MYWLRIPFTIPLCLLLGHRKRINQLCTHGRTVLHRGNKNSGWPFWICIHYNIIYIYYIHISTRTYLTFRPLLREGNIFPFRIYVYTYLLTIFIRMAKTLNSSCTPLWGGGGNFIIEGNIVFFFNRYHLPTDNLQRIVYIRSKVLLLCRYFFFSFQTANVYRDLRISIRWKLKLIELTRAILSLIGRVEKVRKNNIT